MTYESIELPDDAEAAASFIREQSATQPVVIFKKSPI